jgi:integrase
LLDAIGVSEAYLVMKIWRALWKVAGTLNLPAGGKCCDRDADPSLGIRRKTPKGRTAVWREGEAVRLVKRACRIGKPGLACIMAVAWDTMLSPVDVRRLTRAQLRGDAEGPFFEVNRAKTGKAAIGTLSTRTQRLIDAYRTSLPCEVFDTIPLFRTAGAAPGPQGGRRWLPQAYSKDKLARDFREAVAAEFRTTPASSSTFAARAPRKQSSAASQRRRSVARWRTPSRRIRNYAKLTYPRCNRTPPWCDSPITRASTVATSSAAAVRPTREQKSAQS